MISIPLSQSVQTARRKYVDAFNATMVEMWRDRIALLGAVDTGALYQSVLAAGMMASPDASDVEYEWRFLEYGRYVEAGTGREVARGNPGDIGRPKVRHAKPWMSRAFYSSVMNLKEFMADSLGLEAVGIFGSEFGNPISGTL